jgi:hypothetical protein
MVKVVLIVECPRKVGNGKKAPHSRVQNRHPECVLWVGLGRNEECSRPGIGTKKDAAKGSDRVSNTDW